MAWTKAGKPEVVRCTRKLIAEYVSIPSSPRERPFKDEILGIIDRALDGGTFRTANIAFCMCREDEKFYRVNGKHTLNRLAARDDRLPDDLYLIVEMYNADTLADVAELYATFDRTGKSSGDIYTVHAGAVPGLDKIPDRTIRVAVCGIDYALRGDGKKETSPDERGRLAGPYAGFIQWLDKSGLCFKHLRRAPVAAAIFKTWESGAKVAEEFWSEVRDESGSDPESATRQLVRFLLTHSLGSGRQRGQKAVPSREMYVRCVQAWNAWITGESTKLRYYAECELPPVRKPSPSFMLSQAARAS